MTLRSRLILLILATVLPLIAFAAITVAFRRSEAFKAEVRRHRKDGTAIDPSVDTAPLRDVAGRTRGVVTVLPT